MSEHDWRECRPAIIGAPEENPAEMAAAQARMMSAWFGLTDSERQNFHRFCCLQEVTVNTNLVMIKLAAAARGQGS